MLIDRIVELIDYKGINKNKFYKETGLSNGFLDKVKDVGASKIELILNTYPEINPNWLISGKGSMLIENSNMVSEPTPVYGGKEDVSEIETLKKQLEEERERLRQAHKDNGVLEYKLNEAHKEIERLKNGRENVAVKVGVS